MTQPYYTYDAVALGEQIRLGNVSAEALLEATITRAQTLQGRFNFLAIDLFDQAREYTPPVGSPFAGVPFLVKDLNQRINGVADTAGSRGFRNRIAQGDSYYVQRVQAAGFNILGRTTASEIGLKAVTETQFYGPTRNPWDPSRTSGGSSGGTGAAVAAGVVPAAGASDGGGSIRIPAAYGGLFGLKPSRGRISAGPAVDEGWMGASVDGVISRSVRDSAYLLDILCGAQPGDPVPLPKPPIPFAQSMLTPLRPLRIGYYTQSPLGTEVHPEHIAAVEATAEKLRALGHVVEPAIPPVKGPDLAMCYLETYLGATAHQIWLAKDQYGARDSDFELDTRMLGMLGEALSAGAFVASRHRWNEFARALARYFTEYDLYLCPTTAQPPARIHELDQPRGMQLLMRLMLTLRAGKLLLKTNLLRDLAMKSLARTPFTQMANLTGTPAMSVPLAQTQSGLPIGVQFGAVHGQEALLLQLAAQLELAHPWGSRYADLWSKWVE